MTTNPVGTWVDTDRETDAADEYPQKIDNNLAVAKRFSTAFAPHEYYEGSPLALSMKVELDAGFLWDGATLTEVAAQQTAAFVAPVSNPRIDRVVVDPSTGELLVVAGTEAGSPAAPDLPAGMLPNCQVALAVGQTEITNQDITDERALVIQRPRWTAPALLSAGLAISTVGNPCLCRMTNTDVAFWDSTNQSLRCYRYDYSADTWALVGSGLGVTGGSNAALCRMTNTDVAFIDTTNDALRCYRFDGSNWSLVGSGLSVTCGGPALARLSDTDVAYLDGGLDELRCYRFDGSNWSLVGSGLSVSVASLAALGEASATDVFATQGTEIRRYRFDGSTWSQIGVAFSLAFGAPTMAGLNEFDVLTCGATLDTLRVYTFNGYSYAAVGDALAYSVTTVVALAKMCGTNIAVIDDSADTLRMVRFRE